MTGKVTTIGNCDYYYELNTSTNQWELVFWHCKTGGVEDTDETESTPYSPSPDQDDYPQEGEIPVITNPGPITLSAVISEGIRFIDNKSERLTCPVAEPAVLDETDEADSENWSPLTGFPTTLAAGDGDLSTVLVATDFGFNIPADAVIQGIIVEVDRSVLGSVDAALVTSDNAQLRLGKWWLTGLVSNVIGGGGLSTVRAMDTANGFIDFTGLSTPGNLTSDIYDGGSNPDGSEILISAFSANGSGAVFAHSSGPNFTTFTETNSGGGGPTDWADGDVAPARYMEDRWVAFELTATGFVMWDSADGTTWATQQTTPTEFDRVGASSNDEISDIHYWSISGNWYLLRPSDTGSDGEGLWVSTDYGVTWTGVTGTDIAAFSYETRGPSSTRFLMASGTTAMLMIGGNGSSEELLWRTVDTDSDPTMAAVTIAGWDFMYGIASDDGAVFMVACEDGMQISTDHGASFSLDSSMKGGDPISGVYWDRFNDVWFATFFDDDVGYSEDDGATWTVHTPSGTNGNDINNMIFYDP